MARKYAGKSFLGQQHFSRHFFDAFSGKTQSLIVYGQAERLFDPSGP